MRDRKARLQALAWFVFFGLTFILELRPVEPQRFDYSKPFSYINGKLRRSRDSIRRNRRGTVRHSSYGKTRATNSGRFFVPAGTLVNQTYINSLLAMRPNPSIIEFDSLTQYTCTPFTINPIQNVIFSSSMIGSQTKAPTGSLNFGTVTGDGIAVWGSTAGGTQTNGIQFQGIAITGTFNPSGSTPGSALHFGGGLHTSGFSGCYLSNSSTSAGSGPTSAAWVFINDTASSSPSASSEANFFYNSVLTGGYGCWATGLNDTSQKCNDSNIYSCRTAGSAYGMYFARGGQHGLHNWYDRNNESVASMYVAAGVGTIDIYSGEAQNTTGYNFSIAGGFVYFHSYLNTQDGGLGIQVTGGNVEFIGGRASTSGTPLIISGGTVQFAPSFNAVNFTVTGSGGTLVVPAVTVAGLNSYGPPVYSAYTGTVITPGFPLRFSPSPSSAVPSAANAVLSGAVSVDYTPPLVAGNYRINVMVRMATAGTGTTTVVFGYTNDGGGSTSGGLPLVKLGSNTIVSGGLSGVTGSYSAVLPFQINAIGAVNSIGVTITPGQAGTTSLAYSVFLEYLGPLGT